MAEASISTTHSTSAGINPLLAREAELDHPQLAHV
jgi:hypothetical protein